MLPILFIKLLNYKYNIIKVKYSLFLFYKREVNKKYLKLLYFLENQRTMIMHVLNICISKLLLPTTVQPKKKKKRLQVEKKNYNVQ